MNRRQFVLTLSSAPLLAQTPSPAPELDWVDAKKLTVEGLGFKDVKSPYDRLPGRAEGVVPAPVWNLSRDSAGALVRFVAASPEIHARWTVTNKNLAGANITAIASSGLDLYARDGFRQLALARRRPAQVPRYHRSAGHRHSGRGARVHGLSAAAQRRDLARIRRPQGRHNQAGPAALRLRPNPSCSTAPPSPTASAHRAPA